VPGSDRDQHSFKAVAKELNTDPGAVAALARRSSKFATDSAELSDLRESGSIEQDAELSVRVSRGISLRTASRGPGPEREHFKWQTEMEAVHGRAEVSIGKQARPRPDGGRAQFKAEVTRFSIWEEDMCRRGVVGG